MKYITCILVASLFLSISSGSEAAPGRIDFNPGRPMASGELLVKFRSGALQDNITLVNGIVQTSREVTNAAFTELQVNSMTPVFRNAPPQLSAIYRLRFHGPVQLLSALERMAEDSSVEWVQPNYLSRIFATPNDTYFPANQWGLTKIQANLAWDISQGNTDIVIAIIDTGVDYDHPDLASNIWHNPGEIPNNGVDDDGNGFVDDNIGWDFVSASSGGAPGEDMQPRDNDPMDFHGHGTFCAGIASAVTNNGIGIAGVAWNCNIMALRAGYKTSSGDGLLQTSDTSAALYYAADNGADVISMSWGGGSSIILNLAIEYANAAGCVLIAAAGNDGVTSESYPAANVNVMAVAASDQDDARASFSNYGSWVDIAAPGTSIFSTLYDDTYAWLDGTSMATPFVAGAAGLLLSYDPTLTANEVKTQLVDSGDDINWGDTSPTKRLNTYQALLAIGQPLDPMLKELADAMNAQGYTLEEEVEQDTINQRAISEPFSFDNTVVKDIAFGINWLGSTLKLSVYRPNGSLYDEQQQDQPPIIIEVQDAETGEWTYTITGVDVPNDDYAYVALVSSAGSMTIALVIGWNLISIPCELANTSREVALQSINGLYDAVWGYDPVDGWERHVVGGLPYLNTLTDIAPSKGYWVDMSEATNLVLSGPQVEDAIPLTESWNLVGFNHSTEMDLMDGLASIYDYCNSVWGYDPASGWERHVADGLPYLNNMVEFKPGRGYWIDAKAGCPPWDVNGVVVAAPPSSSVIAGFRQNYIPATRPEIPYTIWGNVEANGIKVTDDIIVFLDMDGKIQASYRLGSRAGYGDLYVLDIPANVISPEARLRVQIDDTVIEAASLPPGNPGQIIHLDLSVDMPSKLSMLHQNYPNPFNPETWIPYQLEEGANVVINIHSLTGQLVRVLNLGHRPAGFYTDKTRAAYWDGRNSVGEHVASGVYFYTIQAGEFAVTRKTIVAK